MIESMSRLPIRRLTLRRVALSVTLSKRNWRLSRRGLRVLRGVPGEEVVLLEVVVPEALEALEGREAPLLKSQMTPRRKWKQQGRSGPRL